MKQDFTDNVSHAIERAFALAQQMRHTEVTDQHLIYAFLEDDAGYFSTILKSFDLDIGLLRNQLDDYLKKLPTYSGAPEMPKTSNALQSCIIEAQGIAKEWQDTFTSTEHCLLSFWKYARDPFALWRSNTGLSFEKLESQMKNMRGGRRMDSASGEASLQAVEKFCKNLTELAREGKLDPVIGRDEEIRRSIQVLSRRTKNNPMLIGDPGVGKTAIAEGLAQRIVQGDVPDALKDKDLVALDMGSLIAGTKFRGEFEERLKGILQEIEDSDGNILLFIDEVHTLVGAGATDGAMDAANLLKPALARGLLHCIGSTTLSEYQKYIEKDPALERRFQTVMVQEPSLEDAIAILRGLRERYEAFHGVRITESALHAAVFLSYRYITDRHLPDKAIDLIDEAASMIRMQLGSRPLPIDTKERELSRLIVEQEACKQEGTAASQERMKDLESRIAVVKEQLVVLKNQWEREKGLLEGVKEKKNQVERLRFQESEAERVGDYNRVAELRYGEIPALEKEIDDALDKFNKLDTHLLKEEVDEQLIAQIVGKWTGIPVEKMLQGEAEKLLQLEKNLSQRVVGQEYALQSVSEAIRQSRAGLQDPQRPVGVFLFLGPTGVGKTELAKALAEQLFNTEDAIVRLDMSEYMEKHSVSKLIGSPPGYVGYDEGGQLTEILRRRPYAVVLLDEIEKAHPDVFNILLQIFDDGRITDSKGRRVNCRNAIFIMTSNLGSEQLLNKLDGSKMTKDEVLKVVDPIVKSHFRPEFINRLDDILPFIPLTREDMGKIVIIQLNNLAERMVDRKIRLTWSDEVVERLADEGYDPAYGARPLKRLIQKKVVNMLSTAILEGTILGNSDVYLLLKDQNIDFEVR